MTDHKPRVLIVDDERFYLDLLVDLLKTDYTVIVARDGPTALQRAFSRVRPDLILLDVVMPGMDGYEVCRALKADPVTRDIPVIFLTVKRETDDEMRGFELGAVDYITKPMSPTTIKARVKTHVELARRRDRMRRENVLLEQEIAGKVLDVQRNQDIAIYCLASLAETRDADTGNHIRRTQRYVRRLAEHLSDHDDFVAQLDIPTIELLFKTAPLHDIGKVGLPDRILLKPARLTPQEFEEMTLHTTYGHDAIMRAEDVFGHTPFLRLAGEIALNHHERWNGTGYPNGLEGDDIPLAARLMAVADVYDALISHRVYKPARSHDEALEAIREGSGNHFDPRIADAFLDVADDVQLIANELADPTIA